jgi:hypothetical protein
MENKGHYLAIVATLQLVLFGANNPENTKTPHQRPNEKQQ